MGYCFMAWEKMKTKNHFEKSMAHNFRQESVSNADPEKMHLNKELVKLKDENYWEAYERKIKESEAYKGKTKPRKDAVRGLEVMLTRTGMDDPSKFNQEEWERKNVEWLEKTFGKGNVVSAVCHYDETTPHIHAIVIPMHEGRLNAKHYTGGKMACSEMQTDYAKVMERFGLERGLKGSYAKHTDIKRYYTVMNKELEKKLPEIQKNETAHEYRERANLFFQDVNLKHLGEIEKEKRKTIEAKTKLKDERIAFDKDKEMLIEARAELEEYKREIAIAQKKADRMDELLGGLKNGYLPPEEANEFERTMKDIVNWERARIAEETLETNQPVDADSDNKDR